MACVFALQAPAVPQTLLCYHPAQHHRCAVGSCYVHCDERIGTRGYRPDSGIGRKPAGGMGRGIGAVGTQNGIDYSGNDYSACLGAHLLDLGTVFLSRNLIYH